MIFFPILRAMREWWRHLWLSSKRTRPCVREDSAETVTVRHLEARESSSTKIEESLQGPNSDIPKQRENSPNLSDNSSSSASLSQERASANSTPLDETLSSAESGRKITETSDKVSHQNTEQPRDIASRRNRPDTSRITKPKHGSKATFVSQPELVCRRAVLSNPDVSLSSEGRSQG